MKTITITADMIDLDNFDGFDGHTLEGSNPATANSMWLKKDIEIDGEEAEVFITVYTKYLSDSDVEDMIEGGETDRFEIYNKLAFVNKKWEVEAQYGYTVEVTKEAQDKLDSLHDYWEGTQDEYQRDRIQDKIEQHLSNEQE